MYGRCTPQVNHRPGWSGIIQSEVSPSVEARHSAAAVRSLCTRHLGAAPEIRIFGKDDATFTYVPRCEDGVPMVPFFFFGVKEIWGGIGVLMNSGWGGEGWALGLFVGLFFRFCSRVSSLVRCRTPAVSSLSGIVCASSIAFVALVCWRRPLRCEALSMSWSLTICNTPPPPLPTPSPPPPPLRSLPRTIPPDKLTIFFFGVVFCACAKPPGGYAVGTAEERLPGRRGTPSSGVLVSFFRRNRVCSCVSVQRALSVSRFCFVSVKGGGPGGEGVGGALCVDPGSCSVDAVQQCPSLRALF